MLWKNNTSPKLWGYLHSSASKWISRKLPTAMPTFPCLLWSMSSFPVPNSAWKSYLLDHVFSKRSEISKSVVPHQVQSGPRVHRRYLETFVIVMNRAGSATTTWYVEARMLLNTWQAQRINTSCTDTGKLCYIKQASHLPWTHKNYHMLFKNFYY